MMFRKNKPTTRRTIRRIVPRKVLKARAASNQDEFDEYETEAEPGMKLSQAFFVVLLLHVLAVGGIYAFNQFKEKPEPPAAAAAEPAPASAPSAVDHSASAPPPPVSKPAPSEPKTATVPKPAETPAGKRETYTVVAGDTLRRIAVKFNTTVEALEKANNLSSASIIRTGQVLVVGPASAAIEEKPAPAVAKEEAKPVPAAPEVAPKPEAQESGKTYTVAKGDNPYNIAKRFNTTQAALMKANNIDDPRKLQIGQKLTIP